MTKSAVLKVGMPASLSGQFRVQGRQALTGLQAWAEDVNRAGGLITAGRSSPLQAQVHYYDDASSREQVRGVTERLIVNDRVDLLVGPYSSVLSQAAAAVAEEHQMVLWNQGGASDGIYEQGFRWLVGVLTPASEYLSGLGALVKEVSPRAETLAIVRSSSGSFPKAVSEGAENSAVGLGFRVVQRREYSPHESDFSEVLAEVERARPDVLLAVGRIQNDLALARQITQRNLSLGTAAVVAAAIQQFQDALGNAVEGFIGPSQWESSGEYAVDYGPAVRDVLSSLSRRGGQAPDYPMVQAYAGGLVAQRCLEEAGVPDQRALRVAASSLEFTTFYGRFKIDPVTGKQTGRPALIVQWQGGRKVVVWPPEQRQARLVYPWRG